MSQKRILQKQPPAKYLRNQEHIEVLLIYTKKHTHTHTPQHFIQRFSNNFQQKYAHSRRLLLTQNTHIHARARARAHTHTHTHARHNRIHTIMYILYRSPSALRDKSWDYLNIAAINLYKNV